MEHLSSDVEHQQQQAKVTAAAASASVYEPQLRNTSVAAGDVCKPPINGKPLHRLARNATIY
jgi:hypothetical protein